MTKCPFCGFDNDDGALFCEQCKSDLGMMMALGTAPEAAPQTPPMAAPFQAVPVPAPPAYPEAMETAAFAQPVPVEPLPQVPEPFGEAIPAWPAPMAAPVGQEFPPMAFPPIEAPPEFPPAQAYPAMEAPLAFAEPAPLAAPLAPEALPPMAAPVDVPFAFPPTAPVAETPFAQFPPAEVVPVVATPAPAEAEPAPPPAAPAPAPVQAEAEPGKLPAGAQPRLKVIRGQKIGMEFPIYPDLNFIGRADEKPVDIDLEDQEPPERVWCSRQHALITFEDDLLTIEDLNSANGTYVNRGRVYPGQKRPLVVNDVIQIGTVQMKVIV